ncbi:MAG: chorismate-binding protein [Acidobacteriota bacterium]
MIEQFEIPADLDTPVSIYLKLAAFNPVFLLESVEGGEFLARYSFIGLQPLETIVFKDDCLYVNGKKMTGNSLFHPQNSVDQSNRENSPNPVDYLRKVLQKIPVPTVPGPRLMGGLVGYIGYDFIRFFERITLRSSKILPYPEMVFVIPEILLVVDHVKKVIKGYRIENGSYGSIQHEILAALNQPVHIPQRKCRSTQPSGNKTKGEFIDMVLRAKSHIRAGDAYQIVASIRFDGETDVPPFQIYRALRLLNPSPYMYFLNFNGVITIGSSPEALVRLENRKVYFRPIAGTRPRGKTEEEDRNLEAELLRDEKENAEHVMLVDLARNDAGRIAKGGTVKVEQYRIIEKYSHVQHIVSSVTGMLDDRYDMFDLFAAAFPAGTVAGAPKIRAMQIIDELEGERRGPYAGSVGFFGSGGGMDHAIAIRTIWLLKGRYSFQAGAGIVADSMPEKEYQEIISKGMALNRALEMAGQGL